MKNIFDCLKQTKTICFDEKELDTNYSPIEINNPFFDHLSSNDGPKEYDECENELLFLLLHTVTRNVNYVYSLGLTSEAILLTKKFEIYKGCVIKFFFLEKLIDDRSSKFDFMKHIVENKVISRSVELISTKDPSIYAEICQEIENELDVESQNNLFYKLTCLFYQFLDHPQNADNLLIELNSLSFYDYDYLPSFKGYNRYNHVHYDQISYSGKIVFPKISYTLKHLKNDVILIYKIHKAKNKFNFCLRNYKKLMRLPTYLKGLLYINYGVDVYSFIINISILITNLEMVNNIENVYKKYYIYEHYIKLLLEYKLISRYDSRIGYMFILVFLEKCYDKKFKNIKTKKITNIISKLDKPCYMNLNSNMYFFQGFMDL